MADRTIEVRGKPYQIAVHRKSKTVWIASGTHLGLRIEAQGRSEVKATSAWALASHYRGD
jgi:hypothetical protein